MTPGAVRQAGPANGCGMQIGTMLPPGDVKTYDQRIPRHVPNFPSGLYDHPMPWLRTLQLAVAFAAAVMVTFAGTATVHPPMPRRAGHSGTWPTGSLAKWCT